MIVVEACLVLDVLLNTARARAARVILYQHDGAICAPELLDAEVMQVLRRYVSSGEISTARAVQARTVLKELPIERVSHLPFLDRVWDLRDNMTAYDALYVALAEARQCPLATTDTKFERTPGHTADIVTIPASGG